MFWSCRKEGLSTHIHISKRQYMEEERIFERTRSFGREVCYFTE